MYNSLKFWILKRILRNVVRQNYDHKEKITALYGCIVVSARNEFKEDNKETMDNFLHECFEDSMEKY